MSYQSEPTPPRIEFHKIENGRRVGRFKVTEAVASEVERVLAAKAYGCDQHGNSKAVVILRAVNEAVYAERMDKHGAVPIEDHWFPSALSASRHFGYHHNAVAQALSAAKLRGADSATVGGVEVGWADGAHGID